MMPVAEERGRHTPPLPEGVRAVQRSSLDQHPSESGPRSAITPLLSAPVAHHHTGRVSQGLGRSAALVRLALLARYPFGLWPSLGFTAGGLTVSCLPVTVMSDNVVQMRCHRPDRMIIDLSGLFMPPAVFAYQRQYAICNEPARGFR